MLRLRCPDGSAHDIDLGPSAPAPLRGFSHRSVPGGSFARPLPAITPELRAKTDAGQALLRDAARRASAARREVRA